MISGEVLVRAMSTWVDPSSDGLAWGIAPDGSRAWWGQRSGVSPIYPGSYSHSSGAEGLVPLGIPTTYFENGQYQLGTYLEANQVRLYRSSTVPIGPGTSHPLDRTIAEWRPQAAQDPWFVQFMLQTEARSNTVFRMCWHVRVPSIIRLSCGLFDRLTGDYRGMVLVDDSNGLGAKTWETR